MGDNALASTLEQQLLSNLHRFHAFARGRLGSPELAEDVVQESLFKAFTATATLADQEKAVSWFFQILRSTIIDLQRKQASSQRREAAWAEDHEQTLAAFEGEACRCLQALIPTLKPEYAEIIEALELQGVTPQQLARRLGISLNNLNVRRHRARAQLGKRLHVTCKLCAKHGCLDCSCQSEP